LSIIGNDWSKIKQSGLTESFAGTEMLCCVLQLYMCPGAQSCISAHLLCLTAFFALCLAFGLLACLQCMSMQSVSANGRLISQGPGVSLLAASLPGVQLMPFHVKEPALPSFTAEQWRQLLQRPSAAAADSSSTSSSSDVQQQIAAILLSSPHFVDVEKFLLRLSAALPGMPVRWQLLWRLVVQLLCCCCQGLYAWLLQASAFPMPTQQSTHKGTGVLLQLCTEAGLSAAVQLTQSSSYHPGLC
jgi:hypothetical protein